VVLVAVEAGLLVLAAPGGVGIGRALRSISLELDEAGGRILVIATLLLPVYSFPGS